MDKEDREFFKEYLSQIVDMLKWQANLLEMITKSSISAGQSKAPCSETKKKEEMKSMIESVVAGFKGTPLEGQMKNMLSTMFKVEG